MSVKEKVVGVVLCGGY